MTKIRILGAAQLRDDLDISGLSVDALTAELERRGLLVQLWSIEDFEFIGYVEKELDALSGSALEQIQRHAFEECRRSLEETTTERGGLHIDDWWAKHKRPILERFISKD